MAEDTERIRLVSSSWRPNFEATGAVYEFQARSFTVIRLE
jgi:hypothetical protein